MAGRGLCGSKISENPPSLSLQKYITKIKVNRLLAIINVTGDLLFLSALSVKG